MGRTWYDGGDGSTGIRRGAAHDLLSFRGHITERRLCNANPRFWARACPVFVLVFVAIQKEAADEVLEGEMPLRMYQLMHAHARLSAADR